MTDRNHRARCRRCKGTGVLKGHRVLYAGRHGGCYSCGGRGYLASINDAVEAKRAHLAELLERGTRLAADKANPTPNGPAWHGERDLVATREAYRTVRSELRALEA